MWRVTNTKKIYREASGKLCISVCGQVVEGRGDVQWAEGQHVPCQSIWTTSRTYVSSGVGCMVVRDGRSVQLGKDQTYEFQQTQQNALLLSVTAVSILLLSGLSHGTGSTKMYSRWKERREAQLRRNYKNWPFYSLVGPCQPLQFFLWQGSVRMI